MIDLNTIKFFATDEHPCSYLDDQQAKTIFLDPEQPTDPGLYSTLLDLGFRRSGSHIYRPHCNQCQQCISVRIPVEAFKYSKSQKRILKANSAVRVEPLATIDNEACYQLFERYINVRHRDGDMYPTSLKDYRQFLCGSESYLVNYGFYLEDQLIAVAISDKLDQGLSAVYSFFDPDFEHLSLGNYMILWQIEECKRLALPALYLGYWIKNCQKMSYKSKFRPLEVFVNQRWLRMS